jgi:hypothetical protein
MVYRLHDLGIAVPFVTRGTDFISHKTFRQDLRHIQSRIQWLYELNSQGQEFDLSTPCSTQAKNSWSHKLHLILSYNSSCSVT